MAHIKRNFALRDTARMLRKNMTKQEKHLWYDYLSTYPVRWYKQRIIENFIVDFYCSNAKLIVELDGSQTILNKESRMMKKEQQFLIRMVWKF